MNIFISYTLKDGILSIDHLKRIEQFFKNLGKPYIDILHNPWINPQEHVLSMIKKSSEMYVCITPEVFDSRWVLFEIGFAMSHDIPIYGFDPKEMQLVNDSHFIPDAVCLQLRKDASTLPTHK